eukprot:m.274557 g.274557  ORF g.274557 m.274557 type:complete len:1824 (+) comp19348_c0_seq8:278-5749(+)
MQLKHVQTVLSASDGPSKVTAVAWSPNNAKLAVVTADRVVILYDEHGEKQDKFATKPADSKGPKTYQVTGLAWSPDGTKLAVAQSDCIVFVYKLSTSPDRATEWGEKKSICNKYLQQCPVTAVVWPASQPNILVFGLADGKVRLGKSNKSSSLYSTGSFVTSLCCNPEGTAIASGHVDGSIHTHSFEPGEGQGLLAKHSCPPYALTWGQHVFAAGCDKRVCVYDKQGRVLQRFDYSEEEGEREASVAVCSPSGLSVVLGSFDRLRVFNYNVRRNAWEDPQAKRVENMYAASAIAWKPDGSRLALGTLCGQVDVFDCCLRRTRYKGKFDFTYVGPSQVIVTKLSTGSRIVLRSHYNYEIQKVNVLGNDQFLVAHTTDTLLVGDLQTCKLSEVPWRGSGNEKFFFENPSVCMIFNAGELCIVEYGINEILGSVRTEHMNPHLLSVRLDERKRRDAEPAKRVAYLIDLKTIAVLDLAVGLSTATIDHDAKIDWLELNETARKLLFRDKRRRLHLYDLESEETTTLLSFCSYVQWVPGSDVVVAQNRNNLCIWYNIDAPDRVTTFAIKGEVEDVERANGRTEILVDEGVSTVSYALDEGLIEFGTAIDDGDYVRACMFLETLEQTPESDAMWKTLAGLALEHQELLIAERCFAALGDAAKAKYLHQINEMVQEASASGVDGTQDYRVRARLAALEKQFKLAESIFLEQNQTDEAIQMYQRLHKWGGAIEVAEARMHPDLDTLRGDYSRWLRETGQEETAGQLKEAEGDLQGALSLYMKAGLPARAALLVSQHEELSQSPDTVERVTSALLKAGLYDRAGELYEKVRMNQRALDAYKKGKAYRKAIDLCRAAFPNEVVPLEEEYGDYLVEQKQMDAAINHYIEAGCSIKAIEAALDSRQWAKAAQVVEMQDEAIAKKYYRVIADHYAEVRDHKLAERYYLKARAAQPAVDMYIKAGEWEAAHDLASRFMSQDDVADLYVQQGQLMEDKHKYKEAEKLYVQVQEPDLAINMYKKLGHLDEMIRLVKRYHPDLLQQTHTHLAQELEEENRLTQAESHYVSGDDWKSAVNMYRNREQWEDAYRVAKQFGGPVAAQQVGYLWAKSLGGDSAIKLLVRQGIVEPAIEYACDQKAFEFAFEIARSAAKNKLSAVYLRHAMHLEDEGQFREAEEEFIKCDKAKEAVLMYVHARDWDSAQRVAEAHDPESVGDVLVGQARQAFQNKDYPLAETFLLRAQRPELAVKYYKEAGLWDDVFRLAEQYMPHKLEELKEEYCRVRSSVSTGETRRKGSQARSTTRPAPRVCVFFGVSGTPMPFPILPPLNFYVHDPNGGQDTLTIARTHEKSGEYNQAVDAYLRLTSEHTYNVDLLEEVWEKAVELATKFVPDRAVTTVSIVCTRLVELDRHEAAADLYLGIEMLQEAIDACIQGGIWDKARSLARDMLPEASPAVEAQYVEYLKAGGSAHAAEKLVDVDVTAGLDLFVQRGEWDQCMAAAEKQGGQVVSKYAALYAADMVKQGQPIEALGVFTKFGAPPSPQNFNIYRRVARDLMSSDRNQEYSTWADLREMMHTVSSAMTRSRADPTIAEEFARFSRIAHFCALREATKSQPSLNEVHAKLCVSLLRYTEDLRADKAFHDAGVACKDVGWDNMAFVFLNRYLDLCEAIEDGTLSALDNTEFVGTDVPFEVPLPQSVCLTEEQREEIKEWVLAVSMDDKVEPVLDKDDRGVYVASLLEPRSQRLLPECVVSGYPVLRSGVNFDDGFCACKEEWNKFVMALKQSHDDQLKVGLSMHHAIVPPAVFMSCRLPILLSPFCLQDVLRFLGQLCAAPQNPSYAFN